MAHLAYTTSIYPRYTLGPTVSDVDLEFLWTHIKLICTDKRVLKYTIYKFVTKPDLEWKIECQLCEPGANVMADDPVRSNIRSPLQSAHNRHIAPSR